MATRPLLGELDDSEGGPVKRVHMGGVLRKPASGEPWMVYDNGSHAHHGIGTPEVMPPKNGTTDDDHGYLRVPLSPVGSVGGVSVTGYGAVTPDETITGNGILLGCSVSPNEIRIWFWKDTIVNGAIKRVAVGPNNPALVGETSNLWVTWDNFVDAE